MANVHVVTDSSCDLPVELTDQLEISVVPLTIRFGSEELVDREQLDAQDFYRRMATLGGLPETSAPSPGAFEAVFRRAAEAGAAGVVCVNLSSQMSATMSAAQNAARAVAGQIDVRVVDSQSVTWGLGNQVLVAAEAAATGESVDAVEAAAVSAARRSQVYGALDTLENLKMGGRIGNARALLGQMLSIKPLVAVENGVVEEAGKQRTRARSLRWLRDRLLEQEKVERLAVVHGAAPDIDDFIESLAPRYTRDDFTVGMIGPVIGTHAGPRVIGVIWLRPA